MNAALNGDTALLDTAPPLPLDSGTAVRRPVNRFLAAGALVAVCLLALALPHWAGIASRTYAGPVQRLAGGKPRLIVLSRSGDVYRHWRAKQLHGRTVVNLGSFLHFIPIQSGVGYQVPRRQPVAVELRREYSAGQVDYRNFLWAAAQNGVARRIYHIMPAEAFRSRFAAPGEQAVADPLLEHDREKARIISTTLPQIGEPVLLNIDASAVAQVGPQRLAQLLETSALSADAVTVCLAEDSPDVSDADRQQTRAFLRLMAERGAVAEEVRP